MIITDCDGDRSIWEVRASKEILKSGEVESVDPYHFDVAKTNAIYAVESLI